MRRKPCARTPRYRNLIDLGLANSWFCDRCLAHGDAIFAADVTVQKAVEQIRDAHKLASPDCPGTAFIRLVDLEKLRERGFVA